MNYSVFPFVPRILNTPTLMIVADEDDLTLWDKEIEAFKAIGCQDKELFVTPSVSHMSLYSDRSALEIAAERAAAFFEQKLLSGQPVAV
jgi:alpha-beta hydrolase superfamily lysophospholipase